MPQSHSAPSGRQLAVNLTGDPRAAEQLGKPGWLVAQPATLASRFPAMFKALEAAEKAHAAARSARARAATDATLDDVTGLRLVLDFAIMDGKAASTGDVVAQLMVVANYLDTCLDGRKARLAEVMRRSTDPDLRQSAYIVDAAAAAITAALPIMAAVAGIDIERDFAAWGYVSALLPACAAAREMGVKGRRGIPRPPAALLPAMRPGRGTAAAAPIDLAAARSRRRSEARVPRG